MSLRKDGATLTVNSRTRDLQEDLAPSFERLMINYFGLGEDGRLGLEFEKRRTGSKYCNDCCYICVGAKAVFCPCCSRSSQISRHIENFTLLDEDSAKKRLLDGLDLDAEEVKEEKATQKPSKGRVLFTTNSKDEDNIRVIGQPACFVSTNIHSFMGGRSNLWHDSRSRMGIQNPYTNKYEDSNRSAQQQLPKFKPQGIDDDVLEFNSMHSVLGISLTRGYRLS